jgi:hypothetical protein
MRRITRRLALSIAAVVAGAAIVAGCGGGGGGSGDQSTDFAAFVHAQIADTSETTEPVPIQDGSFDVSEDEHQFDDLFR